MRQNSVQADLNQDIKILDSIQEASSPSLVKTVSKSELKH